ncbi:MAG: DNA pilot protein [Microviridae sp.]|nr:MAG: DNA pilot protein [Microviridae sp.]
MFGIDDAIIAAGVSSLGSLAGGLISSGGQQAQNSASQQFALQNMRENNQFSAEQARINRDFQERMSNSAYQRAMQDMRLAGLNPILAYQQGGAGTPGGAQGTASSAQGAQFNNAMEGVGHGVTSAAKGAGRMLELQQVQAQTANTMSQSQLNKANENLSNANTAKSNQDTATSAAQAAKASAETANIIASAENPAAMRRLMSAQEAQAHAAAGLSSEQAGQLKQYGPHWSGQVMGTADRVYKRIAPALESAVEDHKKTWDEGMKRSERLLWGTPEQREEGWQRGLDTRQRFKNWIKEKFK